MTLEADDAFIFADDVGAVEQESPTPQAVSPKFKPALLTPAMIFYRWAEIERMLADVGMKDHTPSSLFKVLVDPNVRVYLVAIIRGEKIKALIGVELIETPLGDRWLNITFVTGQHVKRWINEVEPAVLHWARGYGCTRAVGLFRKAFKKFLPHWKYTHDYLELEL